MQARPFTALADVYDAIMADVEYDDWVAFIVRVAEDRGWDRTAALDLGCGTGNATAPMAARGIPVAGVDASDAMLRVARAKLPGVPFYCEDVRTMRLRQRFSLAYSVFDALNNLLDPLDFEAAARRVYEHLVPGGVFLFDVNTTVGLRDLWEGGRVEGWADDVYYRWIHTFDEESGLARVEAFCRNEAGSFTEVHYERPYDPPEITTLLSRAGFVAVEALSYPSATPAEAGAARVWMVARRPAA